MRRISLPTVTALLFALAAPAVRAQSAGNPLGLKPHHITASVTDLDRAVNWYQTMLGFTLKERGQHGDSHYAELLIDGFGVALVKEAATGVASATAQRSAPYWMHIVFSIADPDRLYKQLKSRGAKVTTRQAPGNGPVTSFLLQDSEGNEIEMLGNY